MSVALHDMRIFIVEEGFERTVDFNGEQGHVDHVLADALADLALVLAYPILGTVEKVLDEVVDELLRVELLDDGIQMLLDVLELEDTPGIGGGSLCLRAGEVPA
ncbi:MAG: hypothetical protein IIZ91_00580, partial [Oscillospiraceae bacterium]|nr:hypothetical protein [Oscillospiraceae bacterium]